jgi:hypothetical protein
LRAIKHQNVIGWDNFLRGYTSLYWMESAFSFFSQDTISSSPKWDVFLIKTMAKLSTSLWKDRNKVIHGETCREASELLRLCILDQVKGTYAHPPKLDKRYQKVTAVPLSERVKRSTTHLQQWLSHIHHQKFVTKFVKDNSSNHQITLKQAFAKASLSELSTKYPP